MCRFPGCERPTEEPSSDIGRLPEYCDNPGHNRASAWRARNPGPRRAARAGTATADAPAVAADLGRPVTMATARAEAGMAGLVTQVDRFTTAFRAEADRMLAQLAALADDVRTAGDPDAAAVQIAAVTADAEARIAEAAARAATADNEIREARAARDEADAPPPKQHRSSTSRAGYRPPSRPPPSYAPSWTPPAPC